MTRVEELQARADKIEEKMEWIAPTNPEQRYVGGNMPVDVTIGYVMLRVELTEIRREIAGLPPIEARPEQKGEVT